MYELYASTNDIHLLSKHISKLFHEIENIAFNEEQITAAEGPHHSLQLQIPISYQRRKLEEWLINFERSLKSTLTNKILGLIGQKNHKWSTLLSECSQAVLLAYEIEKTHELEETSSYKRLMERERGLIRKLVEIKKSSKLGPAEAVNLGSLLVLALYFS